MEAWGLNQLMFIRYNGDDLPRWDRWFDLHPTWHIERDRPRAYAWYRSQRKPIYRWEVDPDLPSSVAYPVDDVRRFVGADETDFAGSVCWMLALALMEGYDDLHLFWFPVMNEHAGQVPSIRYWIGQARGRGARVTIHGRSDLHPAREMYGISMRRDVYSDVR